MIWWLRVVLRISLFLLSFSIVSCTWISWKWSKETTLPLMPSPSWLYFLGENILLYLSSYSVLNTEVLLNWVCLSSKGLLTTIFLLTSTFFLFESIGESCWFLDGEFALLWPLLAIASWMMNRSPLGAPSRYMLWLACELRVRFRRSMF